MNHLAEIPYLYKLIGSILLAFLLFGIALVLIKKTRDKRQSDAVVRSRENRLPFPQTVSVPGSLSHSDQIESETRLQTIRDHYRAWLERYILPTYDARAAFVRVGVERKRLRYQVANTSLAQGLAMLQSVLIAGDDLSAPDRFERLLAFAITYPSNHDEDLSSWQTLPDMTASPKLEADPHAEAWIAYSLLMAENQWVKGDRYNYDKVLDYRLAALLKLQKEIKPTDHKRAVYAPLFFNAFAQRSHAEDWNVLCSAMRDAFIPYVKGATFIADGSAEEAWLAFSTLHTGLAALLMRDDTHRKLAGQFESLVYDAIKTLPEKLNQTDNDGLSPLALLASCAPMAMLQNDPDLVDKYWQTLRAHESKERDAIGETLRLLALITLNGNFWPVAA